MLMVVSFHNANLCIRISSRFWGKYEVGFLIIKRGRSNLVVRVGI